MSIQVHKRIGKALKNIESILIEDEKINQWAVQRRIFALLHRRNILVLTGNRIIWIVRTLFGGFKMLDVRWQDLHDVKLTEGIFGVSLVFNSYPKTELSLNVKQSFYFDAHGLGKDQAKEIYKVAQNNEQIWREKRRIREIEEIRAHTGNVQVSSGNNGDNQMESSSRKLKEIKTMLDDKLITDTEYETIKAKIISNI